MKTEVLAQRRKELGAFLQVIRGRHSPAEFGFATVNRRRTAGLRREEVAQLVGISPTWYTWIEQGREVNVSAEALDRLASALHLTRSERAYLFELADRRDPQAPRPESDAVPEALAGLLDHIAAPAYLMGRHWDLLGWNMPAAELFTGWLDRPQVAGEPPPNLLRFVFLMPEARQFISDWDVRARRLVAEFRADCRRRLDDPELRCLVDELANASPEFARFWEQHDVLERQGGERGFKHPTCGDLRYQQVTLHTGDESHLKLVMLRPAA